VSRLGYAPQLPPTQLGPSASLPRPQESTNRRWAKSCRFAPPIQCVHAARSRESYPRLDPRVPSSAETRRTSHAGTRSTGTSPQTWPGSCRVWGDLRCRSRAFILQAVRGSSVQRTCRVASREEAPHPPARGPGTRDTSPDGTSRARVAFALPTHWVHTRRGFAHIHLRACRIPSARGRRNRRATDTGPDKGTGLVSRLGGRREMSWATRVFATQVLEGGRRTQPSSAAAADLRAASSPRPAGRRVRPHAAPAQRPPGGSRAHRAARGGLRGD
jgi:hypothetical protein